jgi:two-component system, NtrC family, nitrogen regulation sensor histidine kinase NtrY
LSKLIQDTLTTKEPQAGSLNLTQDEHSDLLRSVNAVHLRSSGLLEFVKAYRSFAAVPVPRFSKIEVKSLLERVRVLMAESLASQQVALNVDCAVDVNLEADPQQIEQVLINLIRNGIEALADTPNPTILLQVSRDDMGRIVIQVIDNGPGIDPAHLDNIFVPFFTTKRGGSGVGLSISRQLVQANRGSISVKTGSPNGTVCSIRFAG